MPEFEKRQNKTCVKFRGSGNVKTNGGRLSGARETSKQTTGDFPKLGKRHSKRRDEKQETCFNHLIKKKEFIMENESKTASTTRFIAVICLTYTNKIL